MFTIVNVLPSLGRWIVSGFYGIFCVHVFLGFIHEFGLFFWQVFAKIVEEVPFTESCHKYNQSDILFWTIDLQGFFIETVHICPQRLPFHLFDIEQVSGKVSPSLITNELVDECPAQLDEQAD
jgi:hypothetical protein